jgi:hypothetical protein
MVGSAVSSGSRHGLGLRVMNRNRLEKLTHSGGEGIARVMECLH